MSQIPPAMMSPSSLEPVGENAQDTSLSPPRADNSENNSQSNYDPNQNISAQQQQQQGAATTTADNAADQEEQQVVIDIPIEEQLRRLLVSFFICYAPHRLIEVPTQIERLTESGASALDVMNHLANEFGMVPVQEEILHVLKTSFMTRLYCFFARFNPGQFRNVPYLAKKYGTVQREFFLDLETKYGADQDPMKLFCAEEKAQKEEYERLFEEMSSSSSDDFEGSPSASHPPGGFPPLHHGGRKDAGESGHFDQQDGSPTTAHVAKNSNNNDFSTSLNNLGASATFSGGVGLDDDDDDEEGGFGGGGGNTLAEEASMEDVHDMLSRAGVDPSVMKQPLPKFSDPLGTLALKKVADEDMEML